MTIEGLIQGVANAAGGLEPSQLPVKATVTVRYETPSGTEHYTETYDADITDVKLRNGGILLEADLDVGIIETDD